MSLFNLGLQYLEMPLFPEAYYLYLCKALKLVVSLQNLVVFNEKLGHLS